jgi:hypothetical protein
MPTCVKIVRGATWQDDMRSATFYPNPLILNLADRGQHWHRREVLWDFSDVGL